MSSQEAFEYDKLPLNKTECDQMKLNFVMKIADLDKKNQARIDTIKICNKYKNEGITWGVLFIGAYTAATYLKFFRFRPCLLYTSPSPRDS